MEPRLPAPMSSPEVGDNNRGLDVAIPQERTLPSSSPESSVEKAAPHEVEPQASVGDSMAAVQAVQFPTQITIPQAQPTNTLQPIVGSNPLAAKDDDLIEREWIQKAKAIVLKTRSDPRLQEDEVSKLQADYLNKRYGKNLELSSE